MKVGITGGIGTGKTTVCHIFAAMGIPIYYADYWAKWLTTNDLEVKNDMLALLGTEAYLPDGSYNRAWVGQQVFGDKVKLAQLNAILHPAVARHGRAWHETQSKIGAKYTMKEAALMIESGSYLDLDVLIVVTAPEWLRIERVMARDGLTDEQVRYRIAQQLPESEKIKHAHFIVKNDGSQSLIQQVWAIDQKIKSNRI